MAIGFHDAYVAAASQKAALEAWGASGNLFAQGIAEQVDDPALMKAPLERPGEVVKVLRGSAAEQVKALGKVPAPTRKTKKDRSSRPSSATGSEEKRRPSRTALDKAERTLAAVRERQAAAVEAMRREEEALARKRRTLDEKNAAERDRLQQRIDQALAAYNEAMADWAE